MSATASSAGGGSDLPADIQKELRDLDRHADLSHYQLLGVTADADGAAIRRAFVERSKRFHPDSWFRKSLGEFGPLLSRAFQRVSLAYQVLTDEESRIEYDRAHAAKWSEQDRSAVERRSLNRAEEDRRARERRERLLRSRGFARLAGAHKLYDEALALDANGERANAIAALKAARELDPARKEIFAKIVELEAAQGKGRSASALALGKEREAQDALPAALSAYGSAFQHDPKSLPAALGAARVAQALGDTHAASIWAARAVELKPGDLGNRFLLAKLYAALSLKAKAKAELQLILAKQADHKEAKSLLKSL